MRAYLLELLDPDALAFLEANGIEKRLVKADSRVFVTDDNELIVDQFVDIREPGEEDPKREVCVNRCGCSAPGMLFQHSGGGFRREAARHPMIVDPAEFGLPETETALRNAGHE